MKEDKSYKCLFKVPVYVSEQDLNDEHVSKMVDRFGIDVVLNKLFGFDKDEFVSDEHPYFYEVIECEHRQRMHPHKIVKCKRYSGIERLDKEWIKGGMASDEAKMSARNDKDYLNEIKKLGG